MSAPDEDDDDRVVQIGEASFRMPDDVVITGEVLVMAREDPLYQLTAVEESLEEGEDVPERIRRQFCDALAKSSWNERPCTGPDGAPAILATWVRSHPGCPEHAHCIRRYAVVALRAGDFVYAWILEACSDDMHTQETVSILEDVLASFEPGEDDEEDDT